MAWHSIKWQNRRDNICSSDKVKFRWAKSIRQKREDEKTARDYDNNNK